MKFEEPSTKKYALELKNLIIKEFEKEFEKIHLSHNLVDTIKVEEMTDGYYIDIPADIYDLTWYTHRNIIVYTGEGSYADEVDISGGFSGTHTNYVDNCIAKAMKKWRKWLMSQKLELRKYKDIHSAYKMSLQRNKNWYRKKSESRQNRELIKEEKKLYKKKLSSYSIAGRTPTRIGKKQVVRTTRVFRAKRQRRG